MSALSLCWSGVSWPVTLTFTYAGLVFGFLCVPCELHFVYLWRLISGGDLSPFQGDCVGAVHDQATVRQQANGVGVSGSDVPQGPFEIAAELEVRAADDFQRRPLVPKSEKELRWRGGHGGFGNIVSRVRAWRDAKN